MIGFVISPPRHFNLEATALSHGWINLAPYAWENGRLKGVLSLNKVSINFSVHNFEGGLKVEYSPDSVKEYQEIIKGKIRYALNLDFPMHDFVLKCKELKRNDLADLAVEGWGRLLRSLTPWEDAVKTLLTTNCNWKGTQRMVRRLCEELGVGNTIGSFAFPGASDVLTNKQKIKYLGLGYREGYLIDLAEQVYDKRLNLEGLCRRSNLDIESVKKIILNLKGFGKYAGNHLLVLLGWHEFLPLDREVLKYLNVAKTSSGRIPRLESCHFAEFERFRFTAYKLERIAKRSNWIG